ncbi:MAG: response regulator transcription factor [Clostridiaceae bacterium]|nr:response regulator transcription factor [Clostridiaceae bacterium]
MKKILVADDEVTLRMLIVDSIEDLGFEVDEAEEGKEALEKIQNNDYDLIILDYMMPSMTGIEVLNSLTEVKKKNAIILMLTAKTQDKDQQLAIEAGVDYFMTKPFSPMELYNFVKEALHD